MFDKTESLNHFTHEVLLLGYLGTLMISNIRTFIEVLKKEGELREITAAVDPNLEAAEIHRRVIAEGGPALLFTNIQGASFPLVTNLFGTQKRVELAFGKNPKQIVEGIAKLPEELMPPSLGKLWEKRGLFKQLLKVGMKQVRPGYTRAESPVNLESLPLLKTWEEDGGHFVTLPLVYTQHPDTQVHNLGMYRLQRFDAETTGLHCQIGKGGGFHLAVAQERNQQLPVTVTIGGPPALILSAIAPLPENVPELLLASLVMGGKIKTFRHPASPYPIVDGAEFVLIGSSDPNEMRPEGPFGDHYGYYSLKHDYPVFHCHRMLHAKNPICTATVVGKPRQEDFF
ncbi:MAG: UbiD family decarboxylase, partial [Bdellovibrionales bacterium]|nr:UbiD family decarboxylase [Bdellovibrionales bacterium]